MSSVPAQERLARFILQRSHLRQDRSVKPDAFIPHPSPEPSVTRHILLSEAQMWRIGLDVAGQTRRTLQGRADLAAGDFERHALQVVEAPVPENVNHANVIGWPAEKPAQKIIALELAAVAQFVAWSPGEEPIAGAPV